MRRRDGSWRYASIEAQCLRSTGDSPLLAAGAVGRSATTLNQLLYRMALESPLRSSGYRVSVHGTLARRAIPAFDTRNDFSSSTIRPDLFAEKAAAKGEGNTGAPYTDPPLYGAPAHREAVHAATGVRCTIVALTTGESYTDGAANYAASLGISESNCTKSSSTKENNNVDASLTGDGRCS